MDTNITNIINSLKDLYNRSNSTDYIQNPQDIKEAIGDLNTINWDDFFKALSISNNPYASLIYKHSKYRNIYIITEDDPISSTALDYLQTFILNQDDTSKIPQIDAFDFTAIISLIIGYLLDTEADLTEDQIRDLNIQDAIESIEFEEKMLKAFNGPISDITEDYIIKYILSNH